MNPCGIAHFGNRPPGQDVGLAGSWIVHSPLEATEFRQLAKIPGIGSDDSDAQAACAHRKQRVVGQAPSSNLLVTVFFR